MPLKEIKTRIGSVKGTLKITSAMKLVAAAKLHKAQQAVAAMLPYKQSLYKMLATVSSGTAVFTGPSGEAGEGFPRIAIIAVSSNSSLCGGFNANAVRKVLETLRRYRADGIPEENVTVIPIGRKMADAMRRAGVATPFGDPAELARLIEHPSFAPSAALADRLIALYNDGGFDRVELIYNHFVSTASQVPVHETWLPFTADTPDAPHLSDRLWLLEPSREELLETLLPKLMRLGIYTMLLDSAAAEHAARTVAMQTATDNGEDILEELTLEYNKGRQQKITSELLDIIGGSMQG